MINMPLNQTIKMCTKLYKEDIQYNLDKTFSPFENLPGSVKSKHFNTAQSKFCVKPAIQMYSYSTVKRVFACVLKVHVSGKL